MAVSEGSSRQGRKNNDGTYRINCSDCGQYISDSYIRLVKVRCEMCARALNGEPVPAEDIAMYNASKLGRRIVTTLQVEDDLTVAGEKFSFRHLLGQVAHAVGFGRRDDPSKLESVKTSKSKRRSRLFESVDLDAPVLGSMEEIDSALEAGKDKL